MCMCVCVLERNHPSDTGSENKDGEVLVYFSCFCLCLGDEVGWVVNPVPPVSVTII